MAKKKLSPAKVVTTWRWRIAKAGITMKEFCTRINKPQSQFSDWINGKKIPRPETISMVEKAIKKLRA